MFSLVARVKTLLVSRYTSPPAWRAGCGLLLSAISFMEAPAQQKSLQEWVLLAENEVQDGDLKELRREASARYAAQHPTKDERRRPLDPAALAMPQADSPGGETSGGTVEQLLPALRDPAADLNPEEIASRLAEFMSEAGIGEALSEGTAGLDIRGMMEMMMGEPEPAGAPPASRDARDALLLKTIHAPGQSCAICQEDFAVKEKAKQLPCQHLYHETCVLQWLEKHNSCPVCRHALESEKQTWDAEASNVQSRDGASTGLYS